jgi:hypothetical protein
VSRLLFESDKGKLKSLFFRESTGDFICDIILTIQYLIGQWHLKLLCKKQVEKGGEYLF